MAGKNKQPAVEAGELTFDMTPMIDVVFQLIIFFMVVISFVESQAKAKLTLPVADQAKPPEGIDPEMFVFNIVNLYATENGSRVFPQGTPPYVVDGKYVDAPALLARLKDEATASKIRSGASNTVEAAVIIRGDRDAEWQFILDAMRLCREAQFTKVYLKALEGEEQ